MEAWKEEVRRVAGEMTDAPQIAQGDIPDIEIYMDQLTTYLDKRLGFYNREEGTPFVTRSMVNNYSKAGLLPPTVAKRYSQVHIMILSLVCQLKRLFTIQDLGRLLASVSEEKEGAEGLYRQFLAAQREAFAETPEMTERLLSALEDGEEAAAKAALVTQLAVRAQRDLLLAERVLDSMPVPDKKSEKKKKKQQRPD